MSNFLPDGGNGNNHSLQDSRPRGAFADSPEWLQEIPPRLPDQPIFYPVLNEEYATQIARDWNVRNSGFGYVTRFQVNPSFLSIYDVHTVGNSTHKEYWIPAERLRQFNENIVGDIEMIAEFHRE